MQLKCQVFLSYVLLLCLQLPAAAGGTDREVVRLSEPVVVTSEHETFGTPLPEAAEVLNLSQLLATPDDFLGRSVQVDTRIARVCQKKGCFFIAQDGKSAVRVSFKDYGFFIPTDAGGKRVRLAGVLQRQSVTAGEARHMNDDLGASESETLASGPTFAIVATAVRVPRS